MVGEALVFGRASQSKADRVLSRDVAFALRTLVASRRTTSSILYMQLSAPAPTLPHRNPPHRTHGDCLVY
jgi:hypothetical protein